MKLQYFPWTESSPKQTFLRNHLNQLHLSEYNLGLILIVGQCNQENKRKCSLHILCSFRSLESSFFLYVREVNYVKCDGPVALDDQLPMHIGS